MDPFAPAQQILEQSGWRPSGTTGDDSSVSSDYQKDGAYLKVKIDRAHMRVTLGNGTTTIQPKTEDGAYALAKWLRENL
jgi:hypothetical protein